VTSTADVHPARAAPVLWVALAVGTALVASVLAAATATSALVGTATIRSGMTAAGVACVGLTLVGVLLPLGPIRTRGEAREVVRVQAVADRVLVVVAGSWLVLVLLAVMFGSAGAVGRPVDEVGAGEMLRWATMLSAGRGTVLTAGCAAVVLGCAILRLRDPDRVQVRIPLIASVLGILTPAVTGHAGSDPDHQLAVLAVAIHAGAAALWVGGLGALLVLLARSRALLDAALPRFSRLAVVCMVAVGLTGVLSATLRVGSWNALVTTGYGWLVVAKFALLLLLAGLGGLTRRRLQARRTPVLRWAGVEVALMAAALGLAAALTQTA